MVFHTNKFGVPMETLSPFYKSGSVWMVNQAVTSAGGVNFTTGDYIEVEFRSDNGGKLTGAYDIATGKALEGNFAIFVYTDIGITMDRIASFKKGIPQTGKKTMQYMGLKFTADIDPELGVAPDSMLFG